MQNHAKATHYMAIKVDNMDLREEEKNREELETSGHKQTDVGFECRFCETKFRKFPNSQKQKTVKRA